MIGSRRLEAVKERVLWEQVLRNVTTRQFTNRNLRSDYQTGPTRKHGSRGIQELRSQTQETLEPQPEPTPGAPNSGPGMQKMPECRKCRNAENGGMPKMPECRKCRNAENGGMPKMPECRKCRNAENGGMPKMPECRKCRNAENGECRKWRMLKMANAENGEC